MRNKKAISLSILFIVTLFSINVPVDGVNVSTNQKLVPFQYIYTTNGSLISFDIQNLNFFNPGVMEVSFVENNVIYYQNFPSNITPSNTELSKSQFNILNLNTTYLNASTILTGVQYYASPYFMVFAIYYSFQGNYYCYVALVNYITYTLLKATNFIGVQYSKTNSLFTFDGSNNVFFEFATNNSFVIYSINNINYTFTKQFESIRASGTFNFNINDVQFYNQSLYVIYNQPINNGSIYAFSLKNSNIIFTTYNFNAYISSISIDNNNTLYAYLENSNVVNVVDLATNQLEYEITNSIEDNFTLIRALGDNSFLLKDFQDKVVYCYKNLANQLVENGTVFNLINSQSLTGYYNPETQNNGYIIESYNYFNYFLAGYLFNAHNSKIGFGIEFDSLNNQPTPFVNTDSTTGIVSSSNDGIFLALVGVLVIIAGLFIIGFVVQKRSTLQKPAKKLQDTETTTGVKIDLKLKLCPSCGSKVSETDVFCQSCGTRIEN